MKKQLLLMITLVISSYCFAQIDECTGFDELYRNRHRIDGMTYGHPYTTFDRHNGLSFGETILRIRERIRTSNNQDPVRAAYISLFNHANRSIPIVDNDDGLRKKVGDNYEHGQFCYWAKNCAFVFLIGLDAQGNPLDTPGYTAARDIFKTRAIEGFAYLKGNIDKDGKWLKDNIMDQMQHYARSLTAWYQCYDMLKAAYELPELRNTGRNPYGFGDADRNSGKCSPRNKLRRLTRDFYVYCEGHRGIVENNYGWKKNHGIKAAACLLLAAQVLNDAGVETNYGRGLFGWLWGEGINLPRPNYSPIKWNKLGYEGLRECLFVGKHWMFARDVPMSPLNTTPNSYSVYAEGPNYLSYGLFEGGLPAMRAQANLYPEWASEVLLRQPEIINIFNWFDRIKTADGMIPSFDNSKSVKSNILALTGQSEYNIGNNYGFSTTNYADFIAIVAGNDMGHKSTRPAHTENLSTAGNLILRNKSENLGNHHFMFLKERGAAIDVDANPFTISETHEEPDYATFMIHARDSAIVLDPAYFSWGEVDRTNHYRDHNVWYYDTEDDGVAFLPNGDEITVALSHGFKIGYDVRLSAGFETTGFEDFFFNLYNWNIFSWTVGRLEREVMSYTLANGTVYYVLNDYARSSEGEVQRARWQLNGPAVGPGGFEHNDSTQIYQWYGKCDTLGNGMQLIHHYAIQEAGTYPVSIYDFTRDNNQQTRGSQHSQIRFAQDQKNTAFQSILMPYPCMTSLPRFNHFEHPNYALTSIQSYGLTDTSYAQLGQIPGKVMDTVNQCHVTQVYNMNNTIYDPFLIGNMSEALSTNAKSAFLSLGTYTKTAAGACTNSKVRFKQASLNEGEYLRYDGKDYIHSFDLVHAEYKLVSKFKYEAYIHPLSSPGTPVTFYLPDYEPGYTLTARDGESTILSYFNDTNSTLSVVVYEPTRFTIELVDQCAADCFFPPTPEPIDTFMVFDTGAEQVLGHDLEIIQPEGDFHITNGSKMRICPNFTFANHQSLVLYALDREENYPFMNEMDGPITTKRSVLDRTKGYRSMIIVNDLAALVLDSGSFTHVGDNATILVLKGGTLLIRKGATVEIGGNESGDKRSFGEIIAEEGAYVCIEDSSNIYFFADTLHTDTLDNNLFYVNLNDYVPTIAGTNPAGGNGKFVDSDLTGPGIYMNSQCIPFCDVKTVMPPYGIGNRDFGYCNFSEPVSRITVPQYVCPGDPIIIKDYAVLNETWYHIEVKNDLNQIIWERESNQDSIRFTTTSIPPLTEDGGYTITLITLNDCGEGDTIVKYVTVPEDPIIELNVSNPACAGSGMITADGSASAATISPIKHIWFVQRLDSVMHYGEWVLEPDDYTMEWKIDTLNVIDSNFTFPGFFWEGGYNYVVGLVVYDRCAEGYTSDTISIPLGVKITAQTLKSANDYIGKYGVELKGVITSAYDSFIWAPSNLLTGANTLEPVTTTTDSTAYILTAYKDNCVARDTIIVKHMEYAHLGNTRVVCVGDSTVVGNYMEASLIMGLVGYLNPSLWRPYFDDVEDHYPDFRIEFTRFLYHHEYQFMEELESCIVPFVQFLKDHREDFYTKPQYARLYEQFLSSHKPSDYIDLFADFMTEHGDLNTLFQDHMTLYGGFTAYRRDLRPCVEDVVAHILDVYGDGSNVNTKWYIDNVESTDDENLFMIAKQVNAPTRFGLLVTNDGTVEYDETYILTDTGAAPYFSVNMQLDSTLFFVNHTFGSGSIISYLWTFGDGDSSAEVNPFHTYPFMDSTWIICLYATNKCGTYQFCDTIRVDTASAEMYGLGKKGNHLPRNEWIAPADNHKTIPLRYANILGYNKPNPFSGTAEIDYELHPDYKSAALIITNPLGQVVRQIKIPNVKGTLFIDGALLNSGIYYYSLIVNDLITETRIMVIK